MLFLSCDSVFLTPKGLPLRALFPPAIWTNTYPLRLYTAATWIFPTLNS